LPGGWQALAARVTLPRTRLERSPSSAASAFSTIGMKPPAARVGQAWPHAATAAAGRVSALTRDEDIGKA
jgi:hypothetical protein